MVLKAISSQPTAFPGTRLMSSAPMTTKAIGTASQVIVSSVVTGSNCPGSATSCQITTKIPNATTRKSTIVSAQAIARRDTGFTGIEVTPVDLDRIVAKHGGRSVPE